ncbi:putative linocin/CFP29 family protein [Paraburkholderia sp. CI3]
MSAKLYDAKQLVQMSVPFTLQREAIDSVERGSNDGDWQPAKTAASELTLAEDSAVFEAAARAR